MKIDGMKEKLLGIGGNVRAKGNATVNGICINYSLNEEALGRLISEMEKALEEKIVQSGQTVTKDVLARTELVESRVIQELFKIEGQISKTEEEIKSAVQENFKRLQKNASALISDIQTDIANLLVDQKETLEAIQALSATYAHDAEDMLYRLHRFDNLRTNYETELHAGWESLERADFDTAKSYFNKVTNQENLSAEAYFGLWLAECKVQLVWDYINGEYKPICYDFYANLDNAHFNSAFNVANADQRKKFEEAKAYIEKVFELFQTFEKNEKYNYDCFICTKVSEGEGKTEDYYWIKDNMLYERLQNAGIRTFYSEIDCKDGAEKGTPEYEAVIFYALWKAKCMLLVCSEKEYLETPWVKNEYTRFSRILKNRNRNMGQIIFVYKDNPTRPRLLMDGFKYQDIDRSNETITIKSIVDTVKNRINKVKGYIAPNYKYCLRKGHRHPLNFAIGASCPVEGCGGTIVDFYTYMNELNSRNSVSNKTQQDEIERLRKQLQESKEREEQGKKENERLKKQLEEAKSCSTKEETNSTVKAVKNTESNSAVSNGKSQTVFPTLQNYNKDEFEIEGTTLKKYKGNKANVVIPNGIVSIGAYAFENCVNLVSIIIPSNVKFIGSAAFYGCRHLTNINISNGVKYIDERAFYGCVYLKNMKIPNSVKSIGAGAFSGCRNLISAIIPSSVTIIGHHAFSYCSRMTMVEIPNTVISIGDKAFYCCANLKIYCQAGEKPQGWDSLWNVYDSSANKRCETVWGFKKVKTEGDAAVSVRKSQTAGSTLQNYDKNEFRIVGTVLKNYNGRQTNAVIPYGVTKIDKGAFSCCFGLRSIEIPNSVRTISERAFTRCSDLKSIEIPDSVRTIGEHAFEYCDGLINIKIPQRVRKIGNGAFSDCSGLTSITADEGNPVYHSKNNCLIKTETKELVVGCKNSVIPSDGSVTIIGNSAFYGCSGLTSIEIPNSVTTIGDFAFFACRNLTLKIPNSVTTIGVCVL